MGNVFKKVRTALAGISNSQSRIVMVGLDNSGKTTILYRIKLKEKVDTVPTIGFNVETVTLVNNVSFLVWDVTGQEKVRPLWKHYTSGADGIMFAVDSCDRLRFEEARRELIFLLEDPELRGVPLIILANKQDCKERATPAEVGESLGVNRLSDREWHIQGTSAMTGDGLPDAFLMLSKFVKNYQKTKKR
ncbi:hypothetical protein LOD99_6766 [Oopsacas minuta]|uniref:Uncharacterized protein n=1 Tax=Oopsacas minuta TaxID=111878 RepID=A0AAV7JK24_9METZ|nr:hypothetical protein LOD99_6766 [Oopsacas minuta]